jgi:hypothetical protein
MENHVVPHEQQGFVPGKIHARSKTHISTIPLRLSRNDKFEMADRLMGYWWV